MQTHKFSRVTICAAALVFTLNGCARKDATTIARNEDSPAPLAAVAPNPLKLALLAHEGNAPLDKEIRRFQDQVRRGQNRAAALERLGWAFVAKARASFDTGFYKLAEACADVLDADSPNCSEALLLRGHVFQNLHRFKDAEAIAHTLVAQRGLSYDYGMLGDTLMEQGRLKEAVIAYQTMVDIRPDLQSYARIAHIRWLTGDLDGAIEMMQSAGNASSPGDADTAAWANTRLAGLKLQGGDAEAARHNCEAALELRPDYPPALLLRGKMLMGERDREAAVSMLERAVQQNPLPEYQWTLAEALRADGREEEAAELESGLQRRGASADPRTYSLYLATCGGDASLAVQLAERELEQREDVFTHDALAWALTAAGRMDEAKAHLAIALAEGTTDARLFFHAAVIHFRAGSKGEAQTWFTRAAGVMNLLLPSEQTQLLSLAQTFAGSETNSEN